MINPSKIFIRAAAAGLVTMTAFGACGLAGRQSDQNSKELSSDTSTLQRRKEFLAGEIKTPRKLTNNEIAITVRIRPQFVLHLNGKLKVTDFEPLNDDAKPLRRETYDNWYRKPYQKAYRHILEQAIIDGYISNVNPSIALSIEEGNADMQPDKGGRISLIDIPTMEEKLESITESSLEVHGISGEVIVSTNRDGM